jgi:hypothetical protein
LQLEKRMSNGVTALVAYTIAKNISDLNTADNAYNRQAERALAKFDVPQRLTISAAWDLPFGKGRRFGGQAPRALDLLAGGWLLSTFQIYQGGFPVTFGLAKATAGANSGRPNAIGNPVARHQRSDCRPARALLQHQRLSPAGRFHVWGRQPRNWDGALARHE